ncbi:MAG: AAA family ATPase [Deltaproteobacteria bacterium]|nr:AAA family ATPase [Deltaproteobacteria bacterium]
MSFYRPFLKEIEKAGRSEYRAICPFHEENNPSLYVNIETGQFHCQACKKGGDLFTFYALKKNLDVRQDFLKILRHIAEDYAIAWNNGNAVPRSKNNGGWPSMEHLKKIYDYCDEHGNYLSSVLRFELPDGNKTFRQGVRNGKGWIRSTKGVRRVLFSLPDVGKASEVIVVEGEKDVETAKKMGFTATCNAMGAGKWRDEYSASLNGKNIVLIPDNDEPGREHMKAVATSLLGIAKSLKWIDLPDLPPKGDLTDWLQKIGDPVEAGERLAILIDGAEPYEPPQEKTIEDLIITAQDFSKIQLDEKLIYLDPWIKENSITLLSGWRGSGKTWVGLSILKAVANQEGFGPWECKSSVPCLFLDGEMPVEDVQERIKALGLGKPTKSPFFVYSDARANQYGLPKAHLANETWRKKMKDLLLKRNIRLWVIDNLASLASGLDENARKDWDPINQWLLELRFAGVATIMLHHTNKDGGQRGTSAREDNIDVSAILKAPRNYQPEDGARLIIHFTKARIANAKLPLIADTEFQLQDENGQYVWTCTNVKKARRVEILRMLDEGLDQKTIAETLGVAKSYVSKVRKKAIKDGLLGENNRLTQTGFLAV